MKNSRFTTLEIDPRKIDAFFRTHDIISWVKGSVSIYVQYLEEEFQCEICGKVCGNAGSLASHKKTHEVEA